jgi:hypothetical protein
MFLYVVFCFEQVLVYSINLLGITWTFSIEEKTLGTNFKCMCGSQGLWAW